MSRVKAQSCQWHYAGLWLPFLLLTIAPTGQTQQQPCAPSSCGRISNISHPFRLQADPQHCGDKRYELACENNITVLRLYSGQYHVRAINYNNFTIRLVDPGIKEHDCSSIPRYFLYRSNFTRHASASFHATQNRFFERSIFEHVVYLKCSNPVRDDPQYVDTAPCVKSNGHVYAVGGDLLAGRYRNGCHVKLVAAIDIVPNEESMLSYGDIHRMLARGFEISWLQRACQDIPIPGRMQCNFNATSQQLQFFKPLRLCHFLGSPTLTCGRW